MIEHLFTKENIALFGVIALFLWRVLDFFFRLRKKKESELQKLAFDMAKYRCTESGDPFQAESIFPYYLFYLDALEHNMSLYDERAFKIMKQFDDDLTEKVNQLKDALQQMDNLEKKLSDHQEISVSDLWARNLTWAMWFQETRLMLKQTIKVRRRFRSIS